MADSNRAVEPLVQASILHRREPRPSVSGRRGSRGYHVLDTGAGMAPHPSGPSGPGAVEGRGGCVQGRAAQSGSTYICPAHQGPEKDSVVGLREEGRPCRERCRLGQCWPGLCRLGSERGLCHAVQPGTPQSRGRWTVVYQSCRRFRTSGLGARGWRPSCRSTC